MSLGVQFGNPSEWEKFEQANTLFVERFPKLFDMAEKVFASGWPLEDVTERMVYGLGLLCWEDFEEIVHLCGNGYGFGAEKILRGMFERLVTAHYLDKNPDQTERFVSFEKIRNHKLATAVQQATGGEGLPKETLEELKAARDEVKEMFTRECPEEGCGRRLNMYTWTELDFVSMAGRAGAGLRDVVWMAYTLPLYETHPSVQAIYSRATDLRDGYPVFSEREAKAREKARSVMVLAHALVLQMFELQLRRFPELEQNLRKTMDDLASDFYACWGTAPDSASAAISPTDSPNAPDTLTDT